MPSSADLAVELQTKRKAIQDLMSPAAKKNVETGETWYDLSAEQVATVKTMNDETTEIAKKYEDALLVEGIARDVKGAADPTPRRTTDQTPSPTPGGSKNLGSYLADHRATLKTIADGGRGTVQFTLEGAEAKTLLTSADINPQAERQAISPSAQPFRDVSDLFVDGTTDSDKIDYYEETTFTNAAAETAEGSAAPESALDFTLRTDDVQEISTFLPATRRSLSDTSGLRSYIEGRLGFMVRRRRALQLVAGNGTTPNLSGILDRSGLQTQAKGADPVPDAVYKAMTLVRWTGDAEPTGAIFDPTDWQDVRLLRTIDGVYIWGSPADVGPERIWGLDVRVSNSISNGTALVGAFMPYAQIFRREGLTIEISTEHSTFFTERKAAILAYERLALAVYRPSAFCQVTGI